MRHLVVLRGAMGSGKSTFIKDNKLKQYTLCPDEIRLLFQSPIMTADGGFQISQKNDGKVWSLLFELLEARMQRGEFTIIDAVHSKTSDFTRYKELAQKYRYRVTCVDFTDIPIDICKAQNKLRPQFKHVPDESIDNVYARFKTQNISGYVSAIKPDEFLEKLQYTITDLSNWKKIHHIGDIHGCYTALTEYIGEELNEDELYIFVGDFVDRGIENGETLNYLISIMEKKNVIFLEGNHEIHLWKWSNDEKTSSKEFGENTGKELEEKGVSKKDVRQLYRKLRQLMYYKYNDKTVIVTHGGISMMPENLMMVATEQFIKGVGNYEVNIDVKFEENNSIDIYQIHGHRNIFELPVQASTNSFNLEGKVEFGGHLRIVTLSDNGFESHEIKNEKYKYLTKKRKVVNENVNIDNGQFLENLRSSNLIDEKQYGSISSFSFKKKVFYDKLWNQQNIKARGLFINTDTTEIVSRSYDKFFNVNERNETKIGELSMTLKFPVRSYLKENGYLGIVGYDSQSDEIIISSKSAINGEFAMWFSNLFYSQIDQEKAKLIKDYLKEKNVTLVFEVIEINNDPHIVVYEESKIVLLDVVYRTPTYSKFTYEEVVEFANAFGFKHKILLNQFETWGEFYTWYESVDNNFNIHDEGYVIEDADGFMTKIKLPWYSFWKYMRNIKEKLYFQKHPEISASSLTTALANNFVSWMKGKEKEIIKQDIIKLRNLYEKESQ